MSDATTTRDLMLASYDASLRRAEPGKDAVLVPASEAGRLLVLHGGDVAKAIADAQRQPPTPHWLATLRELTDLADAEGAATERPRASA